MAFNQCDALKNWRDELRNRCSMVSNNTCGITFDETCNMSDKMFSKKMA